MESCVAMTKNECQNDLEKEAITHGLLKRKKKELEKKKKARTPQKPKREELHSRPLASACTDHSSLP